MKFTFERDGYKVDIVKEEYQFGGIALTGLTTTDGYLEDYGVISVNLNTGYKLEEDQVFVNTNHLPGIDDVLVELGIAKHTGYSERSGFCEYPLMKLIDSSKIPTREAYEKQLFGGEY